MRTILGAVVLCGGVAGLGWWVSQNNAVEIENHVAVAAQAATLGALHPLATQVRGRDIIVSGLVDTQADGAAVLTRLNQINGRRVVVDDLTVLPLASPYVFQSTRSDADQSFSGHVSSQAQRAAFEDRIGAAAAGLTIAYGMPDADWPGVVGQGLDALDGLKYGTLTIKDRAVTIKGLAALPGNRDAVLGLLAGLPAGYTLTDDIVIEDDGTPMRLTIRKDAQGATAVGKLPKDGDIARLAATLGQDLPGDDIFQAQIAGRTEDWNGFAQTGVAALALLDSGTLSISDTDLTLTGTASRAGRDAAQDLLTALPMIYGARSEIDLADDGTPLRLTVKKTATGTLAGGKLPFGMGLDLVRETLGADAATDGIQLANIDAARPDFEAVATAGMRGLSHVITGSLTLQDGAMVLSGTATRSGKTMAETALAATDNSAFDITKDISIADDGRPFSLTVGTGTHSMVPVGKLPFNMDAGLVNSVLGVDAPKDGLELAEVESAGGQWPTATGQALQALGALENGSLSIIGTAITLTGDATRMGRDAALDALARIDPAFDTTADIALLDDGAPFQLSIEKTDEGQTATGKLPFGMSKAAIGSALDGDTDTAGITIAEIADPNGGWAAAAGGGLAGLNALLSGQLDILDHDLTLTGFATRAGRAAALAALDGLPDGTTVRSDIFLYDDGAPFGLRVTFDGTQATASGKLPFDVAAGRIATVLEHSVDTSSVQQAEIGSDAVLNDAIERGLAALSGLRSGVLDVGPGQLVLSGVGTRAARATALATLAELPGSMSLNTDISIADDGVPFTLNVVAGADGTVAEGKLPFGMTKQAIVAGLDAAVATDALRLSEIESDRGFAQTAQTGLSALAELQSGQLRVTEQEIWLTGLARLPIDQDRIEGILAEAADSVTTTLDLTFLDDGTPPAWTLDYAAGGLPDLSGKLPAGMSAQGILSHLGFERGTVRANTGLTGTPDAATTALTSFAPWVGRLQGFTVTALGDDISIAAIAAADEPVDQLAAAMRDTISVPVTVLASPDATPIGAQRPRADGRIEEFTPTGWLLLDHTQPEPQPETLAETLAETPAETLADPSAEYAALQLGSAAFFAFTPSTTACDDRSRLVMENAKITFVTGGSDVDASSADTLDAMARIIAKCLQDPGLAVEISGHTDSRGNAALNQTLSEARAAAVLDAFGQLGMASDRVTSAGYGAQRPIASNDTETGRAANRRTEFTWSTATESQ